MLNLQIVTLGHSIPKWVGFYFVFFFATIEMDVLRIFVIEPFLLS